jgi:hypothetical protein
MKLLLIAASIFFGLGALAQSENSNLPKLLKEYQLRKQFNSRVQFERPIYKDSIIKKLKDFYSMKQKPGVHYLPQDNMPCLVPDTNDIAAIPNAWPNTRIPFQSNIPNPALKSKPLIEQPGEKAK